jgi:hypothetical protein
MTRTADLQSTAMLLASRRPGAGGSRRRRRIAGER